MFRKLKDGVTINIRPGALKRRRRNIDGVLSENGWFSVSDHPGRNQLRARKVVIG
jgi:hypothetical protein